MIRYFFPYPLLFAALTLFWLTLNGFTRGQLLIGLAAAFLASLAMKALTPQKNRVRAPWAMAQLFGRFALDVLVSNVTVARLILTPSRQRQAGFVVVPLDLDNRMGLAVLACVITASPGTAWVDYNRIRRELTIHVLDLDDAEKWRDIVKRRYEEPLTRIFGDEIREPQP